MFGIDDIIGGVAGGVNSLVNATSNSTAANEAKSNLDKALALIQGQKGYDRVEAQGPQGYAMPGTVASSGVADSPEARAMMVAKLKDISNIAAKGMTPKMQAQYLEARQIADTANKGRQGALNDEFARRGAGGSGTELMMREMANQGAGDTMATAMSKQAADNANMEYNANLSALSGAGNLRNQDVNLNSKNSDIINEFNKLNAKNKQDTMNANTYLTNQNIANENNYNRNLSFANTNLANSKNTASANLYNGNNNATGNSNNANTSTVANNNALFGNVGKIGKGFGDMFSQPNEEDNNEEDNSEGDHVNSNDRQYNVKNGQKTYY